MNELQLFKNEKLNLKVRAVRNKDGSISVSLEDTVRGLGFTTVATSGNEVIRWSRVRKYLEEFGVSQRVGKDSLIPEPVFYLLAMKANNEVAKKFQIWVANDVLPAIRKTGSYQIPTNPMEALKLMFDAQTETNERLDTVSRDVQELKENKLLDPGEYNYLSRRVRTKVKEIKEIRNMGSLNKKQNSKLYQAINHDLNKYLGIHTRSQAKAKDFERALEFIAGWEPSYTDMKLIEQLALEI